MGMDPVLARFVEDSPITVMARLVLERTTATDATSAAALRATDAATWSTVSAFPISQGEFAADLDNGPPLLPRSRRRRGSAIPWRASSALVLGVIEFTGGAPPGSGFTLGTSEQRARARRLRTLQRPQTVVLFVR